MLLFFSSLLVLFFLGQVSSEYSCTSQLGVDSVLLENNGTRACLWISQEAYTWTTSHEYCTSMHPESVLATFASQEDYKTVLSTLPEFNDTRKYHAGFTDMFSPGTFINIDGSDFAFSPWGDGEPSGESCGYISFGGDENSTVLEYNSGACSTADRLVVCKLVLCENATGSVSPDFCAPNPWNNVVYRTGQTSSYAECTDDCPLPTFSTCPADCSGFPCRIDSGIADCSCDDYNADCSVRHSCTAELNLYDLQGISVYNPVNDKCYFFDHIPSYIAQDKWPWDDSQKWCQNNVHEYATLASIHSDADADFLSLHLPFASKDPGLWFFTGHNDLDHESFSSRDENDPWVWTDGSEWDYFPWRSTLDTELYEPHIGDNCGVVQVTTSGDFVFADEDCYTPYPPLCQVQFSNSSTYGPDSQPVQPAFFDVEWSNVGSFCNFTDENMHCPGSFGECFGVRWDDPDVCFGSGGSCEPTWGFNKCSCPPGYFGSFCQFRDCTALVGREAYYYDGRCFAVENVNTRYLNQINAARALHPSASLFVVHNDVENRLLADLPGLENRLYWSGYDATNRLRFEFDKNGWHSMSDGSYNNFSYFKAYGLPIGRYYSTTISLDPLFGTATSPVFLWRDECTWSTRGTVFELPICEYDNVTGLPTMICEPNEWKKVFFNHFLGTGYPQAGVSNPNISHPHIFDNCTCPETETCWLKNARIGCSCPNFNLGGFYQILNPETRKCYFFAHTSKTWLGWENYCRGKGGNLASFHGDDWYWIAPYTMYVYYGNEYSSGASYIGGHHSLGFETFGVSDAPGWKYSDGSEWDSENVVWDTGGYYPMWDFVKDWKCGMTSSGCSHADKDCGMRFRNIKCDVSSYGMCQLQYDENYQKKEPISVNVTMTVDGPTCNFYDEALNCPSPQNECFGVKWDDPDVCFGDPGGHCIPEDPALGGNQCVTVNKKRMGKFSQFSNCTELLGTEAYYHEGIGSQGYCYVVVQSSGTWFSHVNNCRAIHPSGKLVVFHSDEEMRMVATLPGMDQSFWRYYHAGYFHITSDHANSGWSTVDGTDGYEYWHIRSSYPGANDCVALKSSAHVPEDGAFAFADVYCHSSSVIISAPNSGRNSNFPYYDNEWISPRAICQFKVCEAEDYEPKKICEPDNWDRVIYNRYYAEYDPGNFSDPYPSPDFDVCSEVDFCNGWPCRVYKGVPSCVCDDFQIDTNCSVRETCNVLLGLTGGVTSQFDPDTNKCYAWNEGVTTFWYDTVDWCRDNVHPHASLVSFHSKEESDFLIPYVVPQRAYHAGWNALDVTVVETDIDLWENEDGTDMDYWGWKIEEDPSYGNPCGYVTYDSVDVGSMRYKSQTCGVKYRPLCQVQLEDGGDTQFNGEVEQSIVENVVWSLEGSMCDFESVQCPELQSMCFGIRFDNANVCSGNGTCKPAYGGNICQCDQGFYGKFCQFSEQALCTSLLGVDAHHYDGNCYVVSSEAKPTKSTWFDNLNWCRSLHPSGKLTTIRSDEDNRLLSHLPGLDVMESYHIGYHDLTSETKAVFNWTSIDGSEQDFHYFLYRNRPYDTNFDGHEWNCIEVLPPKRVGVFGWRDARCDQPTSHAICQYPLCDNNNAICDPTEWDQIDYDEEGAVFDPQNGGLFHSGYPYPSPLFDECPNKCLGNAKCRIKDKVLTCVCPDHSDANCTKRVSCHDDLSIAGNSFYNTDTQKCFYWNNVNVEWGDAASWCRSNMHEDAELASLHSPQEALFFASNVQSQQSLWSGHNSLDFATVETDSNLWTYSDNSPMDYSNWAQNEPQYASKCGIFTEKDGDIEYMSSACDAMNTPLCQLTISEIGTVVSPSPTIDVIWSNSGSECDFTGADDCPSPHNECFGIPFDDPLVCSSNGTCVPAPGNNECVCDDGFYGKFCQFSKNPDCPALLGLSENEAHFYDGNCYVVSSELKATPSTWYDNLDWCRSLHPTGQLMTIHSDEDNRLLSYLPGLDAATSTDYHIGYHDITSETMDVFGWTSTDGSEQDFHYFHLRDRPYDHTFGGFEWNCLAVILPQREGVFAWKDARCDQPSHAICQFPLCDDAKELCEPTEWDQIIYNEDDGAVFDPACGFDFPSPLFDPCSVRCALHPCKIKNDVLTCDCPDHSDVNCTQRVSCHNDMEIDGNSFYNPVNQKCYFWNDFVNIQWGNAISWCRSNMHESADLVSLHSHEEGLFFAGKVPSQEYFWGGHNSLDFATLETDTWLWRNSDGSSMDYSNWATNEPVIDSNCGLLVERDGDVEFVSSQCDFERTPLCQLAISQKGVSVVSSPTINVEWNNDGSKCDFTVDSYCPTPQDECFGIHFNDTDNVCSKNGTCIPSEGGNECVCNGGIGRFCQFGFRCDHLLGVESYEYNGKCYVARNIPGNWFDHLTYARSVHPSGKLAIIHSDDANRLLSYLPTLDPSSDEMYWIGFQGITTEENLEWETIDGSPQDFEYFQHRNQPQSTSDHDCLALTRPRGEGVFGWLNRPCTEHRYGLYEFPLCGSQICEPDEWLHVIYDLDGAHFDTSILTPPSPTFDNCDCHGYICTVYKGDSNCNCIGFSDDECTVRSSCHFDLGISGISYFNNENNKCYYWNDAAETTWGDALEWCRSEMHPQAQLVSLHSDSESAFLASHMTLAKSYYAAHNSLDLETFELDTQKWQNTDGSPLDYAKWEENEPSMENCGALRSNGTECDYLDINCLQPHSPICQLLYEDVYEIAESPVFNVSWSNLGSFCDFENMLCPEPQNECFGVKYTDDMACHGNGTCIPAVGGNECECDDSFGRFCQFTSCDHLIPSSYYYQGKCYLATPQTGTWYDQVDFCRSVNPVGNLAVLHSDDENRLLSYLPGVDFEAFYWSGYQSFTSGNTWKTVDGTEQDFSYFTVRGEPDNDGYCMALRNGRGAFAWYDDSCDNSLHALCQFEVCGDDLCEPNEWSRVTYDSFGAHCDHTTGSCPSMFTCNDCLGFGCLVTPGGGVECDCLDYSNDCTTRVKCDWELKLPEDSTVFNTANNKCYYWKESTSEQWGDSVSWCRQNMHSRANLVSIHSDEDSAFLLNYMQDQIVYQGGFNNLDFETFDFDAPFWSYTDNSEWNYSNWKENEPNTGEGCGYYLRNDDEIGYYDHSCEEQATPFCQLQYEDDDFTIQVSLVDNVVWSNDGSYCDFENLECPEPQNACFGVHYDSNNTCHGKGACVPAFGGNECECEVGFYGRFCQFSEIPINCTDLLGVNAHFFDGNCYVANNEEINWFEHLKKCRSVNPAGKLAVIHSDNANRLLSYIPDIVENNWYWVGYHDIVNEVGVSTSGWTTVDGSKQEFSYFHLSGKPDGNIGYDCVAINKPQGTQGSFYWSDEICYESSYYGLCTYPVCPGNDNDDDQPQICDPTGWDRVEYDPANVYYYCWDIRSSLDKSCFHGKCVAPDTCVCDVGFYGPDCSVFECGGVFSNMSEVVCSGHGSCEIDEEQGGVGVCQCENSEITKQPYFGDDCEKFECQNDPQGKTMAIFSQNSVCGLGECINPGQCECDNGELKAYCPRKPSGVGSSLDPKDMASIIVPIVLVGGCVLFIIVIFAIIVTLMALRWKKRLGKLEQIEGIDILLEEHEAQDPTDFSAKLRVNKQLFQIDLSELKISKKLGEGAGGAVFIADWKGIAVAFKCFFLREFEGNQEKFAEFENEVEILSSANHPHLLEFYGAVISPKRVGVIVKFAINGNMNSFLKEYKHSEGKSFPLKEKVRMMKEIASAMGYLHSKSIIHRDLKMENVVVDENRQCQVMDFGLSKIDRGDEDKTRGVGTSTYMAPEMVFQYDYTNKVDCFSYSILCYVLITENFHPYGRSKSGISMSGIELQVATGKIRPEVERMKGKADDWIIDIITTCWDNDPNKRYTMDQVGDILRKNEVKCGEEGKEGEGADSKEKKVQVMKEEEKVVVPKQEKEEEEKIEEQVDAPLKKKDGGKVESQAAEEGEERESESERGEEEKSGGKDSSEESSGEEDSSSEESSGSGEEAEE